MKNELTGNLRTYNTSVKVNDGVACTTQLPSIGNCVTSTMLTEENLFVDAKSQTYFEYLSCGMRLMKV